MPALSVMRLSATRRNVIANYTGKFWGALMSLLFTPVYARLLGIEAFGLVGFSITLNSLLNLFDMGLSATMNRELAQFTAANLEDGPGRADRIQDVRNLVRSLECIYWPIVLIIALGVIGLAPVIAHRWVHTSRLTPAVVQQAIVLMGLALAFQWPYSLYEGGLLGSQRQVLLNGITIVAATLQSAGVVVILIRSPSILTYFRWQMLISAILTLVVCGSLWRTLPAAPLPARPNKRALAGVRAYATEMAAIAVIFLIITQVDKIIISHRFTLATFGYYSLATSAASALYYGISPLYNALFPRFVQLMRTGDETALAALYHRGSQAASVVILPAALLLAFFAHPLMLLWTRSVTMADHTSRLVSVLAIAYACNTLIHLPSGIQLANGWTRLALLVNLVWVIVITPFLYIMTGLCGVVGAAIVWLTLNAVNLLVVIPLMHRRLLRGEMWKWYGSDLVAPLAAALAVIAAAHAGITLPEGRLLQLIWLVAVWAAAAVAALLVSPDLRNPLLARLSRSRSI